MTARTPRLRNILTVVGMLAAGITVLSAVMVAVLTTLLHHATTTMGTSVESVRHAEEAEMALILHAEVEDPLARLRFESELRNRLHEARGHVDSDEEAKILRNAESKVTAYLERDGGDPLEVSHARAAAYAGLERLVNINLSQSRSQTLLAERLDWLAGIGGVAVTALVIALSAFFVYWVRGPVFRPILDLSRAMEQFHQGKRTVRANVGGPRELREMSERFNEMAATIARQHEEQQAFLAGVAHDLRNPLATLQLATALRPEDPLPPEPKIRKILASVGRQVAALDRMVGDFLDAARIEAGQLDLRLEVRDVSSSVRTVVKQFQGVAGGGELVLSAPEGGGLARVDPLRIEQVTSNLISNAIKYSPSGGRVEVRVGRVNGSVELAVTDHGIGIPPGDMARIFEPYRRGLSKETIPGVGLGLSVVQRIVSGHGGRIEVESAVGRGSTFRVYLPGEER